MEVFSKFAGSTTWHGVPYIETSKTKIAKLFWVAIVLTMFGLLVWGTWQTISAYMSAALATSISMEPIDLLPMPDVLICSKATFDFAKMQAENISLQAALYLFQYPYLAFVGGGHLGTNRFSLQMTNTTIAEINAEIVAYMESNNFTDLIQLYDHFRVPAESFINAISTGDGGPVNMSAFYQNVRVVHQYIYGACYVFSANFSTYWPGTYDGVTLYLTSSRNVSTRAYAALDGFFVSYEKGFAIEVNLPLLRETGKFVQVPLNTITDINIQATNTTFTTLVTPWPLSTPLCNNSLNPLTATDCFYYRYAKTMMQCQDCVPYPFKAYLPGENVTTCLPLAYFSQANTCSRALEKADCLTPCNELSFTTSVTYDQFDTERFLEDQNITANTMDVSFVRLGFASMVVTTIEYSQTTTLDVVVGNFGGQLGLFLGASIITIIHAFESILVAVASKIKNRSKKPKKLSEAVNTPAYRLQTTFYL